MSKKKSNFQKNKVTKISLNLDTTPILYTDNINIVANTHGVVLNFMQKAQLVNQVRVVARIGLDRAHAKKFVEKLGQLLLKTEGKTSTENKLIN